jgi:hypothetical protein
MALIAATQTRLDTKSFVQHTWMENGCNHGWKMENGVLSIEWMLLPVAPADVLELISCNCVKSMCRTQACVCRSHGLKCTDLCGCGESCENAVNITSDTDSENDSSEDELG